VLKFVNAGTGAITLPPYSIKLITIQSASTSRMAADIDSKLRNYFEGNELRFTNQY
jgi:hypothetical protein